MCIRDSFVIDVQLSRLGRLQLDGLIRDEGNALDLIVRSETHLANIIQNNIRTIFNGTTNISGIKGGVNFQAAPADFIDVPDPENTDNVGLVV